MAELTVKNGSSMDWQKRCLTLETQLFKFRLQASKIRELLAEKMQELEQRVIEAEEKAQNAEKQAELMEEKLKLANMKTSESREHKKYQELMNRVQEKDELINQLEAQLEEQKQLRAQEAKIVREKAAKIKDWVTAKLRELELENHYLKSCSLRLTEQIEALQKALQGKVVDMTAPSVSSCNVQLSRDLLSPFLENSDQDSRLLSMDIKQAYQSVSAKAITSVVFMDDSCVGGETETSVPSLSNVKLTTDSSHDKNSSEKDFVSVASPRICTTSLNHQTGTVKFHGALTLQSPLEQLQKSISDLGKIVSVLYNPSDGLNTTFHTHRLDLSSRKIAKAPNCSVSPSIPALNLSRSITSVSSDFSRREGGSMTLPKTWTPSSPRDSIQLAKRHYSQPQSRTDCFHHMVNIEISKFQPVRAPEECQREEVEETDIDEEAAEKMEMEDSLPEKGGIGEETPHNLCSSKEMGTSEANARGDKPPTPPLHRFPSWESRIYAVAKCGMRVSEVALGNDSSSQTSNAPTYSSPGPFTCLIYRNVTVPVYTILKRKATQISNVPFSDESSCSDDDCSSHVSLRASSAGSESRKTSITGSPRAVKRAGVSVSSLSSESDYAIPPDAYSLDGDYSEPEHKLQRTSSYSTDGGAYSESMEKSGYLLKMSNQVKTWKRRWFVLRNGQLMYYKSPSDIICKPQGLVELNSSCQIVRGERSQMFQLVTEKRTYFLTADSPSILEEWIHVLQNMIKVKVTSPTEVPLSDAKPTVKGWLTKVKHGRSKLVWCALIGKTFYYYRNHKDKCPLGYLDMRESKVEEVDRSCDSDEDYEANGGGLFSSYCTLVIHPPDQSPIYLLINTKQEKDTWLYHLTVAAGSNGGKVGTAYEQLIGKLLDAEGDPKSPLWKHPMLGYSKDGLHMPLTTLPSEALQTEALKLFKSCQLFINVPIEAPSIDYHVSLAQTALQVCLTHSELQNEIYCQLVKQTSKPTQNNSVIQCWQLLALCAPLFLPQHHFLWYVKHHLQQHADPRSEIGKYAMYCQRSVERTWQVGEREARPSRMEIVSILLRNPYHHSHPFSIPVHFLNGTYQVVGFDGSSTVEEFLQHLNHETGMRQSSLSGFSLFTDDPSGRDIEHCLQGPMKICDIISKWEQALKQLNPGKYEGGTRTVKLTYKNRLYFRCQTKGETDRERLLLAFQISGEIASGRFPVNKELALEMAALMAQVDYGDLDRAVPSSPGLSSHSKMQHLLLQMLDKFYPKRYKHDATAEQIRQLADQLAVKWMVLQGCPSPECVRIFLTVARKWPLFGAKLFPAKPVLPSPLEDCPLWIAVNEDGISILEYSTMHLKLSCAFSSVLTFGGCQNDFMIVISQVKDRYSGKTAREKLIFAMAAPMIVEVTLLIASYINYCSTPHPPTPSINSTWSTSSAKKLMEIESKRLFPSLPRTTKGPTLL